jgi:hypothetical protein
MSCRVIVSTTINPVTEAIRKYDALQGWTLVVAGDLKTPEDYSLERGVYLSPSAQEAIDSRLSDMIGWNCIQRRNFGLIYAAELGAEVVAVVDDDNIPLQSWGSELMIGRPTEVNWFECDELAFDPVSVTNHGHLWHRGFPLQLLDKRHRVKKGRKVVTADVQADFWNGDPDIDAICRMEHRPECSFEDTCFPIASSAWAPFNSQNTFISGRLLKEYFLFPGIGRMDDIWAAYALQARGARVVFGRASVYQRRNEHNLTSDMKAEYLGYEMNIELLAGMRAGGPMRLFDFLPDKSYEMYKAYQSHF